MRCGQHEHSVKDAVHTRSVQEPFRSGMAGPARRRLWWAMASDMRSTVGGGPALGLPLLLLLLLPSLSATDVDGDGGHRHFVGTRSAHGFFHPSSVPACSVAWMSHQAHTLTFVADTRCVRAWVGRNIHPLGTVLSRGSSLFHRSGCHESHAAPI
jgi:hypothetical protein